MDMENLARINKQEAEENQGTQKEVDHQNQVPDSEVSQQLQQQETEGRQIDSEDKGSSKPNYKSILTMGKKQSKNFTQIAKKGQIKREFSQDF
ncbi:hypothetical protein TTHERM_00619880 (macronuclear) [Tetrahymena thermophila SB210]|uniref:Uncharacterized protein n=1 Tax=Tetrahymena thermophila (strain SB210) TaxID=312017 RepID=Q23MH2_TETTS|nr:hypothetical protein TTHERM_00619880 [Tetrahymena thermophila SB210]EAR97667.3 hypothetical protein TTHERM_00619880 [Tetrahymena thermophila SB210]|eukprot:XP_001017912.3 hypothetical protein TTHERM_00619880 [Tetrahymena thermophila SB210]